MRFISRQSGFGLIEVLITAVILGIGLLGIASLHNRTIQVVKEGDNMVTAAVIAAEMAQRMMTNNWATGQGSSSSFSGLGYGSYLQVDLDGDIAAAGGVTNWANGIANTYPDIFRCYAANDTESCVPPTADINNMQDHTKGFANMQLLDQYEMRLLANSSLPDGEIKICFDNASNTYSDWNCNDIASYVRVGGSSQYGVSESVFTVKVRWTNIFTNTTQIYAQQFTAECNHESCD